MWSPLPDDLYNIVEMLIQDLHCCVITPSGFGAIVQLVENWTNTDAGFEASHQFI